MKILVKNNKERVKNQEAEMKKVQKLLKRSLATGLALVMIVSSMTIVPGSWQVHAAEAFGADWDFKCRRAEKNRQRQGLSDGRGLCAHR